MNNKGNNAVLLQQGFDTTGPFADMMRLTYQRHAAYCRAWQIDFWQITGIVPKELLPGAWGKMWMIQQSIALGYEYIFWVDTDAAIVDFNTDLRDVFKEMGDACIGACEHNRPPVPSHLNVGVLYARNTPDVKRFMNDWMSSFPGDRQWCEQGTFNQMMHEPQYKGIVAKVDDKWNSTVKVNESPKPVVIGWHGAGTGSIRFNMMKNAFINDHLKFVV